MDTQSTKMSPDVALLATLQKLGAMPMNDAAFAAGITLASVYDVVGRLSEGGHVRVYRPVPASGQPGLAPLHVEPAVRLAVAS